MKYFGSNGLSDKQLWLRKANDYFHRSRGRYGIASKTLLECYDEAREDYGPEELVQFNNEQQIHTSRVLRTPKQVVWADATYDTARVCDGCSSPLCVYPTHKDKYRTIRKSDKMVFNDELFSDKDNGDNGHE